MAINRSSDQQDLQRHVTPFVDDELTNSGSRTVCLQNAYKKHLVTDNNLSLT